MRVKCEYCGGYLKSTDETCPNCGAVNSQYMRSAGDTPRTIPELQAWYKARNLPPYKTTRFFIGVNCHEPRAFGIYRDGENFVVYKNKSDGSRVIRYEGTDEAYAVNELYMRLKEEILHQKSRIGSQRTRSVGRSAARKKKRHGPLFVTAVMYLSFFFIAAIVFSINRHEEKLKPGRFDYYFYDSALYYCDYDDSRYTWWKYSEDAQDYEEYFKTERWDKKHPELAFPDGFTNETSVHGYLTDCFRAMHPDDFDWNDYYEFEENHNIRRSHAYIDAGHHYAPYESAYYIVDDRVYYYLKRDYSYDGQTDYGWYTLEDDGWVFLSDGKDRETLGDELWYDDDKYYAGETFEDYASGSVYDYSDENTWVVDENAFSFEDTEYYENYSAAKQAFAERMERLEEEERESSGFWSSSDSDYDWDSGSDWDSGYTDWDSDW